MQVIVGIMNKKQTLIVFVISQFILTTSNFCQDFQVSHLIEIPGNNYDYDVLSPEWNIRNTETYICWINKLDSIYTVYLKQLSPKIGENIVVSSDSQLKSRPHIVLDRSEQGINIAWQCIKDNIWKVYSRNYSNKKFSESIILLDSLYNDPEISLSICGLAWINNGNLMFKEFYHDFTDVVLLDSINCSAPEVLKYDNYNEYYFTEFLYEKNCTDSININVIDYQQYGKSPPIFERRCISNGNLNKNPKYGFHGTIAYQTYENNVWKSVCMIHPERYYQEKTNNINCNYYNPFYFTYPVPTKNISGITPPRILIFDSDSIPNDREVYIDPFYYRNQEINTVLNISQSKGDDYKPQVAYLTISDSSYLSILWQHKEADKIDIWMAITEFHGILGKVQERNNNNFYFNLYQNYPNPFNLSTIIEYSVLKPGIASINIYDVRGKKIKQILNEFRKTGIYKEKINLSDLPSGNYFYRLQIEENIQTKSMIYLK